MYKTVAATLGGMALMVDAAIATPLNLTVERLLDICASPTVGEAAAKGDQLGWQRLSDAQLEAWRTSFIAYNRGAVQVLGWQRKQKDGDESLSFWTAQGPNGHKACTYTTGKPVSALDALSERFGAPDTLDKHDAMTSAFWKRGATQISFTQVASRILINIGHYD